MYKTEGKKIIVIQIHSDNITAGGTIRSHLDCLSVLVNAGYIVHTIVPSKTGIKVSLKTELEKRGSFVEEITRQKSWYFDKEATTVLQVVRILEQIKPTICLTQTGVVTHLALAAAYCRIPHVWYIREFGNKDYDFDLPSAPENMGKIFLGLSELCIANSSAVKDYFFGNKEAKKTIVVHPWPANPAAESPELFSDFKRKTPYSFGILGSLSPGKGQDIAIQALYALKCKGINAELHFWGSQGNRKYVLLLRRLEQELNLQGLLYFHEPIENTISIYSRIDAVIVSSTNEAYGRVPQEASFFKKPIIYSMAGGLTDFMINKVNGIGFQSDNHKDLAKAMENMMNDPILQQYIVENALDLCSEARKNRLSSRFLAALECVHKWTESEVKTLANYHVSSILSLEHSFLRHQQTLRQKAVRDQRNRYENVFNIQAQIRIVSRAFARLVHVFKLLIRPRF